MVFSEQLENLFFFMLSVNFAQSKQEKFNISNTPEYPPELFNFSIKRFRRRIKYSCSQNNSRSFDSEAQSFWPQWRKP